MSTNSIPETHSSKVIEKLLEIVRRQTDYSDDLIIKKLKEHNNNIVDIVREYMKPSNSIEPKIIKKNPATTNQKIFGEIRRLMDDASEAYRKKKELAGR
jgi:hypothetical protein